MSNPIKAYKTLEEKIFSSLPQKEQESWTKSPKIARFGIKAIAATAGFMTFVAAPIVALSPTTPVVAQAPIEEVVEAPKPAPAPVVVAPAPEPKTYEYTSQGALNEMCTAGKQYFGDVVARRMSVEQGKNEVRSYSTYLSRNSLASKSELLAVGVGCSRLWKF